MASTKSLPEGSGAALLRAVAMSYLLFLSKNWWPAFPVLSNLYRTAKRPTSIGLSAAANISPIRGGRWSRTRESRSLKGATDTARKQVQSHYQNLERGLQVRP